MQLEKLGGFRVSFSDGSAGVHDFTTMVNEPGPMLEPLREEGNFSRVFLEFGEPTCPTASTSRRNGCAGKWRRPAS